MDCTPILKAKGYNLRGYSPDTYYYLSFNNAKNEDECEALFYYLEREYG
jgi:hypothetical protein